MSDVQTLIEMGFPKNRALVDVESILNTKHEFIRNIKFLLLGRRLWPLQNIGECKSLWIGTFEINLSTALTFDVLFRDLFSHNNLLDVSSQLYEQ